MSFTEIFRREIPSLLQQVECDAVREDFVIYKAEVAPGTFAAGGGYN